MKLRVAAILLILLCIHCSVIANPTPASDQSEATSLVVNISHQVSDLLQHNALIVNLTKLQQNLNKNIAIKIKELKEQQNPLLLVSLLAIAFIYGIFHAIGPGHGKSIISSWIISQQRSLHDVLLISVFAAALHALSAALIVGGTYVIMGKFAAVSTQKLNTYLQIAAAILVIIIGLVMIVHLVIGRFTKNSSTLGPATPTAMPAGKPLLVAFSIGVVPCPVTSVILIFCLTLGLIWQGILLAISFAVGMGVSLVAVSLLVWSLKEKITIKNSSIVQYVVGNVLPVMGGLFLILIGSTILYSLL